MTLEWSPNYCLPDHGFHLQCVWMPPSAAIDPLTVVFVGFSHADERLGLVYCPIRPAALYMVELSGILSKEENAETEEGAKKMASAFGPSDKVTVTLTFKKWRENGISVF
jgi:hypothetical protein